MVPYDSTVYREELREYIESQLNKGFPIGSIRQRLLAAGHREEMVEEAMLSPQKALHIPHPPAPHKAILTKKNIAILAAILVLGIILAIILSFYLVNSLNQGGRETKSPLSSDFGSDEQGCIRKCGESDIGCMEMCSVKKFAADALLSDDVGVCNVLDTDAARKECRDAYYFSKRNSSISH